MCSLLGCSSLAINELDFYLASDRYCSKIVRLFGLVLSSGRQAEDSPPAHLEGKVWLGWPCAPTHPCSVATMAFRTSSSTGTGITTEVFSERFRRRVHRIAWILWRIWIGIGWCGVHQGHEHRQCYQPYCFHDSQNESVSDQALEHSMVGIVQRAIGHQVATLAIRCKV